MDVLIHHRELAECDFPDRCIRCGARDTVLVATVLTTTIPILGGSFQYPTLELPFCVAHEKPPWFSLTYPQARAFTEEGVIIKYASPDFAQALKKHRRKRRENPAATQTTPVRRAEADRAPRQPVRWYVWALFGLGLVVATAVISVAVAAVVLLTAPNQGPVFQLNKPPPGNGLKEPEGFGPPKFPRR